ncbi:MAG: DNA-3-methyladenine glycosylase [Candidatus Eisenbacteria bacterium]
MDSWWYDAEIAAPRLIGCELVRVERGRIRRGRIVETEAYLPNDPASHSFRGRTQRNLAMFGPPATAYVYRIHQVLCFNVVTGPEGRGEAVLIRALEPLEGVPVMEKARAAATQGRVPPRGFGLTNGPGKLCQALSITQGHDGRALLPPNAPPGLHLVIRDAVPDVGRSTRIGISKAVERPLRFFEIGNRWVSPARPSAP